MPRVATKTKSKGGKNEYNCIKCSSTIAPGEKYYEWAFYRSAPRRRHVKCGPPRQSELTSSKLSGVYGAIEDVQDAVAACEKEFDGDSLVSTIESAVSECESVRDEYQESLDSMGENLAQGDTGQQIESRIEAIENLINEFESVKDDDQEDHEAWLQSVSDAADSFSE